MFQFNKIKFGCLFVGKNITMNESDVEWFRKQASIEKTYDIFYKAQVNSVWVSIIYVKQNDIVSIKRIKQPIQNNKMTHSEVVSLISRNRILNKNKYIFNDLAVYNATISPQDIILGDCLDYFTALEQIQDVLFLDTIDYLQDENELFILLSYSENRSTTKHNKLHIYCRKTIRKR